MTIEKRGEKYRITQMENGKRYRVTVDHKPSRNEAVRLLAGVIEKSPSSANDMRLRDACYAYIDSRSNIISPSTDAEYRSTTRRIPEKYADMYLKQITNATIQALANDYSEGHSTKTTGNLVSFVLSVMNHFDIMLKAPKLPQTEKKPPYIPTKEDVSKIFDAIKGTKYEVPITLAALGLRRSEICALTIDDLDGTILTVSKALVQNEDNEWIVKTTKTAASVRTVVIPDYLADIIREQGYIFKGDPGTIYANLKRAQDKVGVPRFQLHKLRHFFASYMHDLGYSDKQIQEAGGWRDGSRVMKMIYQHAMELDKAKRGMSDSIANLRS